MAIFNEFEKVKTERFVLVKLNDEDEEYYPYYIIQAHNSCVENKLRFEKSNFPKLEVILDIKYSIDSKDSLNTIIKEKLESKIHDPLELQTIYNSIKLYESLKRPERCYCKTTL